jgi:hypothetical protein
MKNKNEKNIEVRVFVNLFFIFQKNTTLTLIGVNIKYCLLFLIIVNKNPCIKDIRKNENRFF